MVLTKFCKWDVEVVVWDRDFTLLFIEDTSLLMEELDELVGASKKTERIKFRENICADKNKNPKQTKPKVSAVSWIIKREFSVYKCSHKVRERGIFSATHV